MSTYTRTFPDLSEELDRRIALSRGHGAVAHEPGEGAPCLERRAPPDHHALQLASEPTSSSASRLRAAQRDDRTRVPERHESDLVAIGSDGGDHGLQRHA